MEGIVIKTLRRSIGRGLSSGEPLAAPFRAFDDIRAYFRRGSMAMIAGMPGSMKTQLAINIASRIVVPTMYFSNDSDNFTMASRMLAMRSGQPTSVTEEWAQHGTHKDYAQKLLMMDDHIKWSFHSGPTLDHLELEMDAFAEIHGEYPHHTIIDILMNVDYPGAGEQNYWGVMAELHDLSRKWETALTIVHHSSEAVKGEPCPPRHAIMGKANQLPVLILTVAPDTFDRGKLNVAVVKNRFGESDLTGRTAFQLDIEPACSRVFEELEDGSPAPAGPEEHPSGLGSGAVDGGHGDAVEGLPGGDRTGGQSDPFALFRTGQDDQPVPSDHLVPGRDA